MQSQMIYQQTTQVEVAIPPNIQTSTTITYSLMQTNGRKVFGPPEDWKGPPPTSACELYVRRIPRNLSEQSLLEPFLRFGQIYQFRLPIDFNQGIRGYAYVRYTNEEDAACAMEALNHYFIEPSKTMDIVNSCEKCRLFVSNIPRHLSEQDIEAKLRTVFPSMQRIYSKGTLQSKTEKNSGYVFVSFANHNDALEAKKNTCPGIIRLWGQDLKVVWANTETCDTSTNNKTLFIRNVDLKLNHRDLVEMMVKFVPRTTIRKISKVRTNAFVDFTCRESAETCLKKMQGMTMGSCKFFIEWAKPSAQQSLHRMRNIDFDAMLRLKCIANMWCIPVIIFGTFFSTQGIQYATVLLRHAGCPLRFITVILQCREMVDIHSRLCEVVVAIIDTIGGFPDNNYVFFAQKDTAHMLGIVVHAQQMHFIASHDMPCKIEIDLVEVMDLSLACALLSHNSEENLIEAYKKSFLVHGLYTYLSGWIIPNRLFGTIMPKYRNKPSLKHNLNDTQIVMALCYHQTGSNATFPGREYSPWDVSKFDCGHSRLQYTSISLLPLSLTQSKFATNHILSQVEFGGTHYYHPAQQVMTPPLWISGCTYSERLKLAPESEKTSDGIKAIAN